MKKWFIVFLLCLVWFGTALGAVPSRVERGYLRTGEEAVAITHRVSGKSGAARIVRATEGYYAVLEDHCLVIVGADASMPEVLGYSSNVPSDIAESADDLVLPPALEEWLKQYGKRRCTVRRYRTSAPHWYRANGTSVRRITS